MSGHSHNHEVPWVLFTVRQIARGWGRSVADGVLDYVAGHPGWQFYFPATLERPEDLLKRYPDAAGVITDFGSLAYNQQLLRAGIPVVVVGDWEHAPIPRVNSDNVAVGRLGLEHFAELGIRHVVFFGPVSEPFACDRERGFREAAEQAGISIAGGPWYDPTDGADPSRWRRLPRPCGVLAASSAMGHQLLTILQHAQVRVPEDIAVLGVDDDKYLCSFCAPPLSAIDQGTRAIGYQAAALLDHLMAGQAPPAAPLLVPPAGITVRQSTQILAVEHPDVAAAIAFIRKHACEGITVGDVLRHVPTPRRTLEIAFRRLLRRGIYAEITRTRVEHAKLLLRTTVLSRAEIAAECGFSAPEKLSSVFRNHAGMTCRQYRAAMSNVAPGRRMGPPGLVSG